MIINNNKKMIKKKNDNVLSVPKYTQCLVIIIKTSLLCK